MANELVANQPPAPGVLPPGLPPAFRQLLALAGLAGAIAFGVWVALWAQEPNYGLLYGNLAEKDSSAVLEALTKSNIPYKLDPASGAILVPAKQLHEARLKLAGQGLPKSNGVGFELMDEKSGFGVSQLQESARYQRAIEGELARSIATMANVQAARVHLAMPKQSAFIRDHEQARASVLVNLHAGRVLDEGQVAAIVHLVAASVPGLQTGRVTVVDQKGRLLTGNDAARDLTQTNNQLEYRRKLEAEYVRRIEEILSPVVGVGAVKAQVVADIDFTVTEETSERFNPERQLVRSEQVAEDVNAGTSGAQGIPGALSNQPPGAASVPEVAAQPPAKAAAGAPAAPAPAPAPPVNTSKRATRNYEIDKTISHTKQATGEVRRVSVAVVVDDAVGVSKKGAATRKPRSPQDLERYTALVREAVGFDAKRGDTVNVVNAAFAVPPPAAALPEPAWWQQDWVWDVAKQIGGVLVALLVLLKVVRPLTRALSARPAGVVMAPAAYGDERLSLGGPGATAALAGGGYDQQVASAKSIAQQDPKRVAQVVKNWVASDG